MKECDVCQEIKDLSNFGVYIQKRDGKSRTRNTCKVCRCKLTKLHLRENPEAKARVLANARKSTLKRKYNLHDGDYEKMYANQNGQCAICGKVSDKKLNIDHCHKSNKVRGLLCWSCNIAIGYMKDSIDNLTNAINYLKRHDK